MIERERVAEVLEGFSNIHFTLSIPLYPSLSLSLSLERKMCFTIALLCKKLKHLFFETWSRKRSEIPKRCFDYLLINVNVNRRQVSLIEAK